MLGSATILPCTGIFRIQYDSTFRVGQSSCQVMHPSFGKAAAIIRCGKFRSQLNGLIEIHNGTNEVVQFDFGVATIG